jgi:multidrug efflux pump subunit AcrA (membrane-fusion protein)
LTVSKHNVVDLKRIQLGSVNQSRRAIVKGLKAEDRVIVDGLQNASLGNAVDPRPLESSLNAEHK